MRPGFEILPRSSGRKIQRVLNHSNLAKLGLVRNHLKNKFLMKHFTPFNRFIYAAICLCLITVFSYGQPVLEKNQAKDISTNSTQTNAVYSRSTEPDATNIIVTIDGNTYYHAKVVLVGHDGLSVRHVSSDGISEIAFIQLTNLPPDYQKKWGPYIQDQANEFNHEKELKDRIKQAESENTAQNEQQIANLQNTEPATKPSDTSLGTIVKHWVNINIDHGAFIALEDDSVWEISRVGIEYTKQWQRSAPIVCSKTTAVTIGYDYALSNIDYKQSVHAKYIGYAKRWIKEN